MKAMILAAGKGTRMRPLTYSLPKPMIPLLGKPVMESIIEHLKRFGVDEIVVNTSFLAPIIQNYFTDGAKYGTEIAYSFEGKLQNGEITGEALGSAGGMKRVQEFSGFFDDTFIVLCGDTLIDFDIDKVIKFHKASKSIATIVLKEVPWDEVHKYGVVKTESDGRIVEFQEKPEQADAVSNLANTGIYVFEPEVFTHIPKDTEYDIGGDLFPALAAAKVPFFGTAIPFQWVDIGSIPDYWDATRLILNGSVKDYKMPGKEIKPGVYCGINQSINFDAVEITGPVYIASGVAIGDGAKIIGPTMIGANCRVDSGAVVDQCILGEYTWVRESAMLEQKLVFDGNCIGADGEYLDIQDAGVQWLVDDARAEREFNDVEKMLIGMATEADAKSAQSTLNH
jgi:mannose-1-phosphate guanylyltransferase